MLRACALDMGDNWDQQLHLIEFFYNNSYHHSIQMAPFEALYGRPCRSPLCWNDDGESRIVGPALVEETREKIRIIQARMKTAQSRHKSYADVRRLELSF